MTVHISGYTGFIGRNLAPYLSEKGYHIHPIDLRNARMLVFPTQTKAIIHLAGKAHDVKKASVPDTYYQVNTELTKKAFDAFLISDAEVFITLSSVKAVADTVSGILTENSRPQPSTHYGKSKRLAEEYILSKPIPPGKRVYILRPCMIHGPGNKGNLNLLYSIVSKRVPWPLAAFDNQRSFTSIDNLCFIINELIEQADIPSGIYQVADDDTLSTNELVTLIGQALHFTPKRWHIPPAIIKTISKIGDMLHLPLNTERLNKLTENYVVSNKKIKKALKKKLPLSAKQGVLKTISSFKKNETEAN